MNERLRQSLVEAEAVLSLEAQDRLSEIVEAYIANHGVDPASVVTPEELSEIEQIAAEPFVPADPVRVKAFFEQE